QRQEDTTQQADDERVQRDLAEQEGPVVGKDLAQVAAGQRGQPEALVGPPCRSGGRLEHRTELWVRTLGVLGRRRTSRLLLRCVVRMPGRARHQLSPFL